MEGISIGRAVRAIALLMLLVAAPLRAAKPAAAWMEAESTHFVVTAYTDEEGVRAIASRLERFDSALRYQRGMTDPGTTANKVHIFVVFDRFEVSKLCYCGAMGVYYERAGGAVAFTPIKDEHNLYVDFDAQQVLFHEYTHHFMEQNFPGAYPGWFTEGFAEFNGTARLEQDGSVVIGVPNNARAAELGVIRDRTIGFILANAWNNTGLSEPAVYGGGWLITHYLMMTRSRAGQLDRYLLDINKGMTGTQATKDAFGDLKTLEDDILAYLHKPMNGWVIPADKIHVGSINVRTLGPGEAATMPARLKVEAGYTPLLTVEQQARAQAAAFPDDPAAQTLVARACYNDKSWDCADAAADHALAADPKRFAALLIKGETAMQRAARNPAATPADWAAARRWLVRANHLEPDNTSALTMFFDSYRRAGIPPDAAAIAGMRQAYALDPEVQGIRWRETGMELDLGNRKAAREALAPIVFATPDRNGSTIASTILARIDKGDDGKAIAKAIWDQMAKEEKK